MRRLTMTSLALGALATLAVHPAEAQQRRPRRATTTIEIRGQVPTPQVVTVRPREVPDYHRQVLLPSVAAQSVWAGVLPPYQLPSHRQIAGAAAMDTMPAEAPGLLATMPRADSGAAPVPAGLDSASAAKIGASYAEIAALRRDIALRRARLDSLEALMRVARPVAGIQQPAATPQPRAGISAADSAARAAEIEAIRRELEYRKARLDSLENLVKTLGRPRSAPPDSSRQPR